MGDSKCKKCGNEIDRQTKICSTCGTDNHNYIAEWNRKVLDILDIM